MGSNLRPLGLEDDAFQQRRPAAGLITKAEVRAVSLYFLALRPDSVVWDIGAGTGSVGMEAAVIASQGTTYAIERDTESFALLRANIAKLGPSNVEPVFGEAPDAFEGLPDPDSIFVGGSGGRLDAILRVASNRMRPQGRIVANLAALERAHEAQSLLRDLGLRVAMSLVSVSRGKPLPDGGTRLQALNPVFIVVASRRVAP